MSESRLCDHGYVYGCLLCERERRALIQKPDMAGGSLPPSMAVARRLQHQIPEMKTLLDMLETLVAHIHGEECADNGCRYFREANELLRSYGRHT